MGENISRYVYLGSNGGEITFCIMSVLWSVLCSYNNNCWRYKAFEVLIKVHFTISVFVTERLFALDCYGLMVNMDAFHITSASSNHKWSSLKMLRK